MKSDARYMTARQASAALGVSMGTLYSYVSRGTLHSESVVGKPRLRRYLKEDVARLIERKEFRKNPGKAAVQGLHWGSPVLDSALTLIDGGRLFYRGIDAIELAQRDTVEEVAALLWTGDSSRAGHLFESKDAGLSPKLRGLCERTANIFPPKARWEAVGRCEIVLPLAAALDLSAYDLRPGAVAKMGARILRLMFAAVYGASRGGSINDVLTHALPQNRAAAAPALRAALILCADHELNVSAFTARCIASARATPYEVVRGGLAALRGLRHGGASEQVEALFDEAEKTRRHREILAKRLRLLGGLPGFGHPLYAGGDPRAALLISLARTYGRRAEVERADSLIRAARSLTDEHPNLDFGLVTLTRALGLPSGSAITLFALGRTVGWIAHAIEQYADTQLIRPRARYVGPVPQMA